MPPVHGSQERRVGYGLGVDLGTTYTAAAVHRAGRAEVFPLGSRGAAIPSVVLLREDETILTGEAASRRALTEPERVAREFKRRLGDTTPILVGGSPYSAEALMARLLRWVVDEVRTREGGEPDSIAISHPANWGQYKIDLLRQAVRIAGLGPVTLLTEPEAAAIHYAHQERVEPGAVVAVYDLGGGTFDISILEIGDGVFEVKSTNGDTFLGGEDFDMRIVDYLADEFRKDQGIDLRNDKLALQRLKEAAEKAKIELSSATQTEINLPFITADATGPKHLAIKLTRAKLEALVDDLIQKTIGPCKAALKDAGVSAAQINEVVLVGGMTRMPKVIETVKQFFGKEPHKGVNPDEVVAVGAAIQAGVLQGEVKDVLLLDVTPLSLGIETLGGVFTRLIERNTTIPTKKSQVFSTADDNQTAVTIRVFQGEREIAQHNKLLGQFDLMGIPPAPRGVPQIEVAFDIDANGIVNVSAKDKATGKEQVIRIQASGGLSEAEIDKMVKDAEAHASEDKKRKELVEAKNHAESLMHSTQKSLAEFGDKVSPADKQAVEAALADLKSVVEGEDKDAIEAKTNALAQAAMKLGEAMYKASQGGDGQAGGPDMGGSGMGGPGAGGGRKASDDGVVDADFEEVKDDDRKSA